MEAKSINIKKFNSNYVLDIKLNITKEFKFRIFMAKKLMQMAGFFLNCDVKLIVK